MLNNSFLLWKFKIFICHFGIVPYLKWLTFLQFQAYLEGAKQKTKSLENFAKKNLIEEECGMKTASHAYLNTSIQSEQDYDCLA